MTVAEKKSSLNKTIIVSNRVSQIMAQGIKNGAGQKIALALLAGELSPVPPPGSAMKYGTISARDNGGGAWLHHHTLFKINKRR